ncbi:MFS transporter [Bosea sp. (in: a-proteobacteria)]
MSLDRTLPGAPAPSSSPSCITPGLTRLFALAVGLIVTNIFAPQTLIGVIAPALGLTVAGSGLIAMATLLGYAIGLFLLVPLGDIVENRALVVRMLSCAAVMALAAALAPSAAVLLTALFCLGGACAAIQVLVPIAAGMAAPERRGRVIGDVMSGLMLGILLARPLASLVADLWGWRAYYGLSAAVLALLAGFLAWRLPRRPPTVTTRYPALILSLWHLLRDEPVLRARAFTAALSMAAFSLFWTAVALRLAQPPFGLDQRGIALFALAGAGGALATSIFGRLGDRGWSRPATTISHLLIALALFLAGWAGSASADATPLRPLLLLGLGAILVDIGVTGDQTLGRHAVNLLRPAFRGRLNGLYVGLFFLGGAAGSSLAGLLWVRGGWSAVCAAGVLAAAAMLVFDGRRGAR